MDPREISKFADLLRNEGDKVLNADFKLSLSGSLLRALNDSFTLIIDDHEEKAPPQTFQVLKPNNCKSNVFRDLQIIFDFFQKTEALCLCNFLEDDPFDGIVDLITFRNLRRLEVRKVSINQIIGLQQLRSQIKEVVCVKSVTNVKELIVDCGGDHSNGFIWTELKKADFSFNSLDLVDSSFEFTPYIQNLNLSHNKIVNCSAIKWLPNLKILNLSFNHLTHIPKFNAESYRKLQVLIINDNLIEDISGLARLDALAELDLSGNCLLDHSILLPLSSLPSLMILNLASNPLGCHTKHRVATCRYLNKNAANDKFVLDGELLSKKEKSLAGAYEHYFPLYGSRFGGISLDRTPSHRSRCDSTQSTTSLVSMGSMGFEASSHGTVIASPQQRKIKPRSVVIEDIDNQKSAKKVEAQIEPENKMKMEGNKAHLETKQQIEELRQKFGNEWLQSQGATMVQNVMGFEALSPTSKRREMWSAWMSTSPEKEDSMMATSTPNEVSRDEEDVSMSDATIYDNDKTLVSNDAFVTAMDQSYKEEPEIEPEEVASEPEENETKFIVIDEETHMDCLLVISDETIKEKDPATGRTKTRWGMSSLESCERLRMNLIRLNFDTIRKDKKERSYDMDPTECQELERLLRDILASRPLSEMNMTVYKCAKCNTQFSREINKNQKKGMPDIKCPECNNIYVIVIENTNDRNTSPKQKVPAINESGILKHFGQASSSGVIDVNKKNNILTKIDSQSSIGSAGSLKDSSSCSQISRTDSSFDSNRSVAGSSNSERDKDVDLLRADLESDIEILSNPSQSSIEVLDSYFESRKYSEERRISQVPSLDTIEDDGINQIMTENLTESVNSAVTVAEVEIVPDKKPDEGVLKSKALLGITNVNLTESSSSGSVTDSVCTAYEPNVNEKVKTSIMSKSNDSNKIEQQTIAEVSEVTDKKDLSSMLGGLLQSTNLLMSKTPKPKKDAEPTLNIPYEPIKYNYENYSIVDHRLKLFLFQSVLEDRDEKFVWLAKGFISENQVATNKSGIYYYGVLVMSTTKFYVLKEVADESEEVSTWLKRQLTVTVDRVERVKVLPWKIGMSFHIKGFGHFDLLLQDITRTGGLLYYLGNRKVPDSCEIDSLISETLEQKILRATNNIQPILFVVFKSVFVSSEDIKNEIKTGCFIVTEKDLYITKSDFEWLNEDLDQELQLFTRQPMTNLVELENVTNTTFVLNFMDENEDRTESWKFEFETKTCIDNTLQSISQIWDRIFGVPLIA